jgi:hypothetical protein
MYVYFIAYYLALTQLGFIFSVKESCVEKFKGLRCFGGPFWAGAPGQSAPLSATSLKAQVSSADLHFRVSETSFDSIWGKILHNSNGYIL